MKRIILLLLIFILIGCVYAEDFSKITVNGVDFEIPSQYSSGDVQKSKYVYNDLRTFAILCVDDYIISNYGGFYDIADFNQDDSINNRPVKLLTTYNKYIEKNVSYLYFPVEKSVYCICFQADNITPEISHIVESAPEANMSDDTFYGLLDEAKKQHDDRQYYDTLTDDNSYYVSQTNQHENNHNDQLIKWYLLTHW